MEQLRTLFARLGYKPALLRDIVKSMSAEGITDVDAGFANYLSDDRQTSGWNGLLSSLDNVEHMVLFAIGQGLPPLGKSTLQILTEKTHTKITPSKVRASIEKLRKNGILTKTGSVVSIDDPLFAEFVKRNDDAKGLNGIL